MKFLDKNAIFRQNEIKKKYLFLGKNDVLSKNEIFSKN